MRPERREHGARRASQHRTRRPSRLSERVGQSLLFKQTVAALALLAVAALLLPGDFPVARQLREEVRRLVHEQHDLREVMARLSESPVVQRTLEHDFLRALLGGRRPETTPVRLLMPTEGEVTLEYGWHTHPVHQDTRFHPGVDFAAPRGSPVRAAEAGTVARISRDDEYGLMVELDHGQGLQTRYAHLETVKVASGVAVERGEEIGRVGQSGQATGPHLHFEVLLDGEPQDPADWLGMEGKS